MAVIVRRRTGILGALGRITLKVNGEKGPKIKNGDQVDLILSGEQANVSIRKFEGRSNQIIVQDGDIIELTTTIWSKLAYSALFIYPLFLLFEESISYRLNKTLVSSFYVVLIVLLVFFLIFLDSHHFKKIGETK